MKASKLPVKPSKTIAHVASLVIFAITGILCGLYLVRGPSDTPAFLQAGVSMSAVVGESSVAAMSDILADAAAITPDYTLPPAADGLAPVLSTIPTNQKVVFLGIDDGSNKQEFELRMLKNNHIKASLFLSNIFIADNPSFFKSYVKAGYPIEDHTVNHLPMSQLTYDEQVQEICGEADLQLQRFGRRPTLFRPPGGDYNQDTQRAAAACGMKAIILWIAKANGGSMQYQIGDTLRPGDIVLMHFRPEFAHDLQAFIDAQKAAGLRTVLLEDWLDPAPLDQSDQPNQ